MPPKWLQPTYYTSVPKSCAAGASNAEFSFQSRTLQEALCGTRFIWPNSCRMYRIMTPTFITACMAQLDASTHVSLITFLQCVKWSVAVTTHMPMNHGAIRTPVGPLPKKQHTLGHCAGVWLHLWHWNYKNMAYTAQHLRLLPMLHNWMQSDNKRSFNQRSKVYHGLVNSKQSFTLMHTNQCLQTHDS